MLLDEEIDDGARIEEHSILPFEDYEFDEFIKLKDQFPADVVYKMEREVDEWRVLYDTVNNMFRLLMISKPFKTLLEKEDCGDVEYLPIAIMDKRGKIASPDYFVANLLDSVDYIDLDKSIVEYSALDETRIFDIEKLILKEDRIPNGRALFRTSIYPTTYIVSDRLKKKIEKAGLSGMMFIPVDKYDSTLL